MNIIAISPKSGMEQAEIIDTFWTYQYPATLAEANICIHHDSFIFFMLSTFVKCERSSILLVISACSMPLLGDIATIFIHFHTLLIIFGLTY